MRIDTASFLGAHAEAAFVAYALENGWEIAAPFNKAVPYDFIIRRDPEVPWETVQVKRAYYVKSKTRVKKVLEVGFRRSKGSGSSVQPYKDGDFDWLFSYHEDGQWMMPWDLLRGKRSAIPVGGPKYDLWKV